MALNTVGDLRQESHGHLAVKHFSLQGDDARLADFGALVWSPHSTPKAGQKFPFLDPQLQAFLETPAGQSLRTFGHIRGDVGADEIADGMMSRLRMDGYNPLFLAPAMGGRMLMDHNRPLSRALLFPVPSGVRSKLEEAYDHSMNVLFQYFQMYRDRLRGVFQSHTMGGGEFDEDRVNDLVTREEEVRVFADTDFVKYQDRVMKIVDGWDEVYTDGCNHGPQRPDMDIVTSIHRGQDKPLDPILDQGLSRAVRSSLAEVHLHGVFNHPFPHIDGYPGTRLSQLAAEVGVPQITTDVSKRHVVKEGEIFRASTFEPDQDAAWYIGLSIAQPLKSLGIDR